MEYAMDDAEFAEWSELNQKTEDDDTYYDWISKLNIGNTWKDRLRSIVTVVKRIGTTTLNIGKIVLNILKEILRNFPQMTLGILIGLVFGALISCIPFIGQFLAPLLTPFVVLALGLLGFVGDVTNYISGRTQFRDVIDKAFESVGDGSAFRDALSRLMRGIQF
ncbi:MAG: hypothetical protein LBK08_02480 [Treponema sp.]|jgi:hypothetical protein|nr:hypothetical protein [Treponema sp.]